MTVISIKPGDIVLCRFPTEEHPGQPGPKLRPCLVTGIRRSHIGLPKLEVAFGTTSQKSKPGISLVMNRAADLRAAGLDRPTQFLLRKRALVNSTPKFIGISREGQSVLGRIPDQAWDRTKALLNSEKETQRKIALRFGRRNSAWNTSHQQTKEIANAK